MAGRLMRSREKWQSAPIVRPPTGRQPPIQGYWVGRRCCSRAPTAPPPRRLKKAVPARLRTRSTASWRFDVAARAPGSRIPVEPRALSLSALTTSHSGDAISSLITYQNSQPRSPAGILHEAVDRVRGRASTAFFSLRAGSVVGALEQQRRPTQQPWIGGCRPVSGRTIGADCHFSRDRINRPATLCPCPRTGSSIYRPSHPHRHCGAADG